MTNTNKLIATKRVENVLRHNVEARDNDSVLYTELLRTQYNCSSNMRYTTLEKRVNEGVLPSRDLVTRLRRKIQHEDETMRGSLWAARQNYANVVRKTI